MKSFWKNKKVLVTGAAGFIGSYAVKVLLGNGAIVTAIISPRTDKRKIERLFKNSSVKVLQSDLLVVDDCLKVTKNQDIILNFAAIDGGSSFKQSHSAEIFQTNTRIVLNMLDAAVANKVDRFLLMSSIEIYSKDSKTPIKEKYGWNSQDDANGYVWSKRFGEIAAKMYAKEYGLKIAIARSGNVYGPGDVTGIEKGRVIPTFIHKILNGEKIELFEGGTQKKQFIYISDLVAVLLDLVEKYPECDPVNIVGSEIITIKELSRIINCLVNNEAFTAPQHNIFETPIDNAKLKKKLRYRIGKPLSDGLNATIRYYEN